MPDNQMRSFALRSCFLAIFLAATLFAQNPAPRHFPGEITVAVDASEASTRLFHSRLTIPVQAGPLTLLYPEWIPGEHGPTGPIADLTGLKFFANGERLQWRRDDVNMYAIHVDVPAGVTTLEATLDYTSPIEQETGFSEGSTASAQLALVSWNWTLLYPAGYPADQITYRASLRIPAGWKYGTALPVALETGDTIQFKSASLYTVIDSPVISGHYFRAVRLTPPAATPTAEMDIAADSDAALQMPSELETSYKNLVAEATTLFGATHYRDYHFLYSLSDHVAHFGLEHHESNDSRTYERTMINYDQGRLEAALLPHEYVHSWNGKYRRPAGLTTPAYDTPMKGNLLWVYEGLTNYLGVVLTTRSGLQNPEQWRDDFALSSAQLDNESGRTWRPLIDTAVAAQILYEAPTAWSNWRRSVDYYDEGTMLWLWVDVIIRQQTHGTKSIDDFCKLFYGPPSLPLNQVPGPKPYTFEDLVTALNQVTPYDWTKFFNDILWTTAPHAPMGGIEGSGWHIVYTDVKPDVIRAHEEIHHEIYAQFTLGLLLSDIGLVKDANLLMPGAKAGIMPGMQIIAVNGRAFSADSLHDALGASKTSKEPLELIVKNADYFKTVRIDYHGGERYPHLERNSQPDLLSDILKPHATH
jgi:predicted metalloprotease with PDZ domain